MVMQRKRKKPEDRTVTAVPAATAPSSELSDRPRRRTFTAQTKLRILAKGRQRDRQWRDRSDPAPGGLVLVDPYGLASAA